MAEEFRRDSNKPTEPDTIIPSRLSSEDSNTSEVHDKTKEMIPDPTTYVEEMVKEQGYPRSFQVCVNAMRSALREMSVDSISISQPEEKNEWIKIINRLTALFTKNFRTFYIDSLSSREEPKNNIELSVNLDELFAFFPNNLVKATAAVTLQNALDKLLQNEKPTVNFWVDFTKEPIADLEGGSPEITDSEAFSYNYSLTFSFSNIREKWFHYYEQDFLTEDRANMPSSVAKNQQPTE